jgi:hypothetical protein
VCVRGKDINNVPLQHKCGPTPPPPPFFSVLEFSPYISARFIIVVRHTKRTFVELKEWKKEKRKLTRPFFPSQMYTRGIILMKTNTKANKKGKKGKKTNFSSLFERMVG